VIQQLQNFLDDHFFVVWCLGVAFCLVGFAAMAWWQISRGPKFPSLSSVNILHRERFASGCSHRSIITRLGGAHNMLHVVLTDTELWVTTFAYFRGLAGFYDMDHRIPLTEVMHIEDRGKSVLITFNREDHTLGVLQLRLRDKDHFISQLASRIVSVDARG
jgi:hypothetical protein